jgi:hypothetical protein
MNDSSYIVITRHRWDVYMLPLFVVSVVVAIGMAAYTSQWRFLTSPLGIVPFWIMLRVLTPRSGMLVRTISGTPGAVPQLIWALCILALAVLLTVVDSMFLGHGFREPLLWYHWIVGICLFATLLVGVAIVEKKWPRVPPADNSDGQSIGRTSG